MDKNNNAVIMFIYNRPEHTQQVLEGLKRNNIEKLYIFADGPRKETDRLLVDQTRDLINEIDWCVVEKDFSDVNRGLANSVIYGVSKVINKGYESVIILEDDCVPIPQFITYMRSALNYYKDNEQVMHVSGFGLPIRKYTDLDVYVTPYPCSWGWGTWAKYWNECDFNREDDYRKLLEDKASVKAFNYSGEAFSAFLQMQLDKKVNSWLIRWYYHIYSRNGRCIWSYDSLIENKGFDGTGVHKVKFDRFNQKVSSARRDNVKVARGFKFEDNMTYNPTLIREFRRYFIDKSVVERLKTVIYLSTGLIMETSSRSKVRA